MLTKMAEAGGPWAADELYAQANEKYARALSHRPDTEARYNRAMNEMGRNLAKQLDNLAVENGKWPVQILQSSVSA